MSEIDQDFSLGVTSFSDQDIDEQTEKDVTIKVLSLFQDDFRNESSAPFSIQNVIEIGHTEHNKAPGEWYGVSKMNEITKALFEKNTLSELKNIKICTF